MWPLWHSHHSVGSEPGVGGTPRCGFGRACLQISVVLVEILTEGDSCSILHGWPALTSFPAECCREFDFQNHLDRMCCPCKEILKFVIIFVNTLLGFGFLFLALLGVIMLTAPEFLRKIIDWFLYRFAVDDELRAITTFIKDNFTTLSMALITVGLIFACIAFIGAFASCCECTIVLGVYTALLGVFLVLQSLLLAVLFLDKNLYMRAVTDSLSGLIRDYGSETGVATAIWSAIMREVNNERCCGMDSSRDFIYSRLPTGICPKECCPWSYPQRCHCSEAQAQSMPGCRDRITAFVEENMQVITYILSAVLGLQAIAFAPTDPMVTYPFLPGSVVSADASTDVAKGGHFVRLRCSHQEGDLFCTPSELVKRRCKRR
ncbi:hypothetical protein SprV_0902786400 [Sparganum proliferum]